MKPVSLKVVVGGGITGLSAAWALQKAGCDYVLLEASARWGGKVLTDLREVAGVGAFVLEAGPDSFQTLKPWALDLAREAGIAARLQGTNPALKRTFVLHRGRPQSFPEGLNLIVPTKLGAFFASRLFSPWAKFRVWAEGLLPRGKNEADETLADFVRRRFGREMLDKVAEPLLAGIHNSEPEQQSLLSTFPRFREMERQYGSLRRAARSATATATGAAHASSRVPAFASFPRGMEEWTRVLVSKLTGDLRLNTGVEKLESLPGARWRLTLDGKTLDADSVLLCVPAFEASRLTQNVAPEASALLAKIRFVGTGTITLAYRRDQVAHPLDGYGLLIPRSEKRSINAVTWTSSKFDGRAPGNYVLLRVFFGGSKTPWMMEKSDEEVEAIAHAELESLLGAISPPLFASVKRWEKGNPQYDLGHSALVERIEAALPKGLKVAGCSYRGVGLPDCVHQGEEAVRLILAEKEF